MNRLCEWLATISVSARQRSRSRGCIADAIVRRIAIHYGMAMALRFPSTPYKSNPVTPRQVDQIQACRRQDRLERIGVAIGKRP